MDQVLCTLLHIQDISHRQDISPRQQWVLGEALRFYLGKRQLREGIVVVHKIITVTGKLSQLFVVSSTKELWRLVVVQNLWVTTKVIKKS